MADEMFSRPEPTERRFLALCRRGPHQTQIHHERYGKQCCCPCHGHLGDDVWFTGEHY